LKGKKKKENGNGNYATAGCIRFESGLDEEFAGAQDGRVVAAKVD
jgi:hypothetical protein